MRGLTPQRLAESVAAHIVLNRRLPVFDLLSEPGHQFVALARISGPLCRLPDARSLDAPSAYARKPKLVLCHNEDFWVSAAEKRWEKGRMLHPINPKIKS